MTQVNSNRLISYKKIDGCLSFISFIDDFQDIFIYSFNLPITEVQNNINFFLSYPCEKYLDNFLIISPQEETIKYNNFWKSFFEYFSSEYENIIDVRNNQENILFLYNTIKNITCLSEDSIVLDFACGTGLSVEIIKDVKLLGVDVSRNMCKIANLKGLATIDIETLCGQSCQYDAIFSSYALHICHDAKTLSIIWNSLKTGMPLVANFHKSIGVKNVHDFISQKNGDIIHIKNDNTTKHGEYYAYIKR